LNDFVSNQNGVLIKTQERGKISARNNADRGNYTDREITPPDISLPISLPPPLSPPNPRGTVSVIPYVALALFLVNVFSLFGFDFKFFFK